MVGMRRYRRAFSVLTVLLLATTLVVIWVLTVQTPSETTALSGWWADALTWLGVTDAGQASFIVRKAAHTAEFLPVGVLVAVSLVLWFGDDLSTRSLAISSTLFCLICSLSDQLHKLFVPGREFDGRDLVCDAVGYLLGIIIVLVVHSSMNRRARHRSQTVENQ